MEVTERWNVDDAGFNEEFFRQAVSRMILFRSAEKTVSSQGWYSGGYRANIVTYSIAKIAYDVSSLGKGMLDFGSIWQKQGISAALTEQIASTSELVYGLITNPPPGQQNVTQWCKRDDCWLRVKREWSHLLPALVRELVAPGLIAGSEREAKVQQEIDSGIDVQTTVVGLGQDYWRELLSWGTSRQLISSDEASIVRVAAGFGKGLPSDKQSRRLLILQKRLELEGFRPA